MVPSESVQDTHGHQVLSIKVIHYPKGSNIGKRLPLDQAKAREQAAVVSWIGTFHCSLDTQSPLSLNLSIENNSEEEGPFAWLLIALILV